MKRKTPTTITSAAILFATITLFLSATASAATEKVLYAFPGGVRGYFPNTALISDSAGNLYGTSGNGGAKNAGCPFGCGTVFELSPKSGGGWTKTVLYSFTGKNDGGLPQGGLTMDSAGNLYGTTAAGGTGTLGVVFELIHTTSGWSATVLYNFCASVPCLDGTNPQGGVIFDKTGNLYGVTSGGGTPGAGVVYELTHSASGWTQTVLYNFCSVTGCSDGANPVAGLTLDGSGNLYGTTINGGAHSSGVVFELAHTTGGWMETPLYTFCSSAQCADGANPSAGVTFDPAGNLYGTTSHGGGGGSVGVVFEITQTGGVWTYGVIYAFIGGNTGDGEIPNTGLIFDPEGHLYGTTSWGGSGCGTVFKLTHTASGWSETKFSFSGTNGGAPYGGLLFGPNNTLYGTTQGGGQAELGTVYELTL